MRNALILGTLLLGTALAHAQVVSPLGGSTNNPPGTTAPAANPAGTGVATPAQSAAPAGSSASDTAARPHRARRTLAQRFQDANTTHDGHLTPEQARAGRLNAVARDFDQIDTAKRGYVTLDQIRDFQKQRRAARKAARAGQAPASQ